MWHAAGPMRLLSSWAGRKMWQSPFPPIATSATRQALLSQTLVWICSALLLLYGCFSLLIHQGFGPYLCWGATSSDSNPTFCM